MRTLRRPRLPLPLVLAVLLSTAGAACGGGSHAIDDSPPPPGYTLVGTTTDIDVCDTGASATLLRCTADAATLPRLALGVCGDLAVNNTLTLDTSAASGATGASGSAGANAEVSGQTTSSAPLVVGGDFDAMGSVTATNTQTFGADFGTLGNWTTSAPVTVAGNAGVGGTLAASSTVNVTGTLTTPATAAPASGTAGDAGATTTTSPSSSQVTAGSTVNAAPEVDFHLACAGAPDLATLIGNASAHPDMSADAVLPHDSLVNVDAPTELTLGCGQYTLDSIAANATLTLHVRGTTLLVVTGDVHVAAPVVIDVTDGATFDLAIGGALNVDNTLTVGDAAHAGATWVGVNGALTIGAPMTLGGQLLVLGAVTANNTLDVTGSLYAFGLQVASPVNVHSTSTAPAVSESGCFLAPPVVNTP